MMILSAIIMVPRTASPSVGIERRPPTHLMYLCLEIMAGDDFRSVTYFLTWQNLFGSTNGTDLENDLCAGKSTLTLQRRHTTDFSQQHKENFTPCVVRTGHNSATAPLLCTSKPINSQKLKDSKSYWQIFVKFDEQVHYGPQKSRLNSGSDSQTHITIHDATKFPLVTQLSFCLSTASK